MTSFENKQIKLVARPSGIIKNSDFSFTNETLESPKKDEVIVEHLYAGLDPGLRGWMDDFHDSYAPPVPLNAVMPCTCISRVLESQHADWQQGDLIWGLGAWQKYQILSSDELAMMTKLDANSGIELQNYLSVCGFTGLTAYCGMLNVGQPKDDETILISGAAGAVGSIAGQLAKLTTNNCRLVGIAGSEEKCQWLTEQVGFDEVINYRDVDDMSQAMAKACPDGIDLFFDNVGGDILDAALMNINFRARVLMCGTISNYNDEVQDRAGPKNMWQLLVKNARIEGFTVAYYAEQWGEQREALAEWVRQDKLVHSEHIVNGLENTLDAFRMLFTGENKGRVIMRFAGE